MAQQYPQYYQRQGGGGPGPRPDRRGGLLEDPSHSQHAGNRYPHYANDGGQEETESRRRSNKRSGFGSPPYPNQDGYRGHSRSAGGDRRRDWSGERRSRWGQADPSQQGMNRQQQAGNGNNGQGYGYHGNQSGQHGYGSSPNTGMEDDVTLSKALTFILRHGAEKSGFKLMAGGFIYVDEILRRPKFRGITIERIEQIVKSNDKQRYALQVDPETKRLKIRANQGHTIQVDDLDLRPITDPNEFEQVIHGTYHEAWGTIKKQGMRRMGRNHMHFAPGVPGESGVISGMRSSCEILIYLNLAKALKDGIKFFISANNVILTTGNDDGVLYPCYFEHVVNRYPFHQLEFDRTISGSSAVTAESVADEADQRKNKKQKKKNKKNKKKQWDSSESGESPTKKKGKEKKDDSSDEEVLDGETMQNTFEEHESFGTPENQATSSQKPERMDDSCGQYKDVLDSNTREKTFEEPDDWFDASENPTKSQSNTPSQKPEQIPSDQGACSSPMEVTSEEPLETVVINDSYTSNSALDILMKEGTVAVWCLGNKLGMPDGKISNILVVSDKWRYDFNLVGNEEEIMKAGKLRDFLMGQEVMKVFHKIAEQSKTLFSQLGVVVNGSKVYDTQVAYDMLPEPGSQGPWLVELQFLPDKWISEDADNPNDINATVERCSVMLKAYRHFDTLFKIPAPKREIFEEVNRLLTSNKEETRNARKEWEKSVKASPKSQQASPKSQQASPKSQQSPKKKKK